MFEDIGVLNPEPFLRVVELDPNPAFCEIAYIVSRGFLVSGLVLVFTIKLESFRTHIEPACSTRFRTFKGGRQSRSSNTSTTATGAPRRPQLNHLRGGVVQHRTRGEVFLEKHRGARRNPQHPTRPVWVRPTKKGSQEGRPHAHARCE